MQFCEYIFMTTHAERNTEKNTNCQIHCCTICTNFMRTASKNIIQYLVHLRIIWVVKLMDYFISDSDVEVMFQEIIYMSMLIFAPVIIFLTNFISIILIWFIVKEVFYFTPCAKKLVVIKYILKRHMYSFIERINIISPLLLIIPPPQYFLR